MTPLGKPLVFYLKYMAEMNRLYADEGEGEEPDLTGLDNTEQVREMVRTVGDAANEQAADFLELCGKGIEDHFSAIGVTFRKRTTRLKVLNTWYWWGHVRVPSVPSRGWFSCAVCIPELPDDFRTSFEQDVWGIVLPDLWVHGGRRGAEAVRNILGGWPHSRLGEELVGETGAVALACIPIKLQPPESFDVDGDSLAAEVMKTITRIGAEETKAIVNFVASLKKSDES